ncbi:MULTISPECIES: hypothetical protein [Providencia]|uniref:hypothetical protein n=1 Tax=Providencia TaxID=586 RepID=UPI00210630FA|nr:MULTISPECIES: hypothetical protein [Providencia]
MATKYVGEISFENYWGEKITSLFLQYHMADIYNSITSKRHFQNILYYDIPDKSKVDDIMWFVYEIGAPASYNYWYIHITTESGKSYLTKKGFYCSITEADEGKVILGVNGESENLYVHYPASSGCSTKMKRDL